MSARPASSHWITSRRGKTGPSTLGTASASHEVHGVKPQVQRGRGLLEDRPGCRMDVMPAARAGPRLPALLGRVLFENSLPLALGALGMFAVLRVAGPPQVFQTGGIVRELTHELHERVVRIRGLLPRWGCGGSQGQFVKCLDTVRQRTVRIRCRCYGSALKTGLARYGEIPGLRLARPSGRAPTWE